MIIYLPQIKKETDNVPKTQFYLCPAKFIGVTKMIIVKGFLTGIWII